jgi:hypothetical protein
VVPGAGTGVGAVLGGGVAAAIAEGLGALAVRAIKNCLSGRAAAAVVEDQPAARPASATARAEVSGGMGSDGPYRPPAGFTWRQIKAAAEAAHEQLRDSDWQETTSIVNLNVQAEFKKAAPKNEQEAHEALERAIRVRAYGPDDAVESPQGPREFTRDEIEKAARFANVPLERLDLDHDLRKVNPYVSSYFALNRPTSLADAQAGIVDAIHQYWLNQRDALAEGAEGAAAAQLRAAPKPPWEGGPLSDVGPDGEGLTACHRAKFADTIGLGAWRDKLSDGEEAEYLIGKIKVGRIEEVLGRPAKPSVQDAVTEVLRKQVEYYRKEAAKDGQA